MPTGVRAAMRGVAVVGVGATDLMRHGAKTAGEVAVEASVAALEDAGLTVNSLDGYVGCFEAPNPSAAHFDGVDEVSSAYMCQSLGLQAPSVVVDLPQTALAIGLLSSATLAIQAGEATRVLIVRAMFHDDSSRYSFNPRREAGGVDQFSLPYGLGKGGGRQALWWRRYLHDYSLAEESLYSVVANARRNARGNGRAYWRQAEVPSKDEYLAARYVYSPLRVLDCDIPVTGAVAFVLCSADLAYDAPHAPVFVRGFASRHVESLDERARRLGAATAEIQSWQMYDGFSVLLVDAVERAGLCDSGEGMAYLRDLVRRGKSAFVNSFGGSIGEGRMHGMGHLLEAVLSVSPRAWRTPPERVSLAAADIGMWDHGGTVLFGDEAQMRL